MQQLERVTEKKEICGLCSFWICQGAAGPSAFTGIWDAPSL